VVRIVVEIFSVTFLVMIERGIVKVDTESTVLVAVTTGTVPLGVMVEVMVTVCGIFTTENGSTLSAVKSIHVVLEKKLAIWKEVASRSVIWWEKEALVVLNEPGPVFWYSPKNALAVRGLLEDH